MKCFRLHEHWTQQGRCWCWCCCRFHLDDNADSNLKSHTINRINTGETSLHGLLFESIFYCSLLLHSQASETLYLFHQKSTCCQNNGITVEKDLEISWIQIWSRHSQNRVLGASLRILLISMWENWWEQYVKGSLLIPSKPPPPPPTTNTTTTFCTGLGLYGSQFVKVLKKSLNDEMLRMVKHVII